MNYFIDNKLFYIFVELCLMLCGALWLLGINKDKQAKKIIPLMLLVTVGLTLIYPHFQLFVTDILFLLVLILGLIVHSNKYRAIVYASMPFLLDFMANSIVEMGIQTFKVNLSFEFCMFYIYLIYLILLMFYKKILTKIIIHVYSFNNHLIDKLHAFICFAATFYVLIMINLERIFKETEVFFNLNNNVVLFIVFFC